MKGIYLLLISVDKSQDIKIGALGTVCFNKGLYAYVGSAQNNLENRLKRHFRGMKRRFWHIDYLLDDTSNHIINVFYKEADKTEECEMAHKLGEIGFAIKNFGSSDCSCIGHLFQLNDYCMVEDLCLKSGFRPFHFNGLQ